MKNTNAFTKRKLTLVITTIVTGIFAAFSSISTVQAAELIQAEPIKQESLINQAQENLALTFSMVKIESVSTKESAVEMIASEKTKANKNKIITLSKTTLLSE